MKRAKRSKNRGFTLLEMIVAGAIFLIVVGGVMYAYINSAKQERSLSAKVDLFRTGRRAYFQMTEEIKMGTNLMRPAREKTAPVILFTNYKNELISYFLEKDIRPNSRNRIRRINFNAPEGDGRVTTVAEDVEELRFTRRGPFTVSVRMFLKASEKDRLPLASSISLRNVIHPIESGLEKTTSSSD